MKKLFILNLVLTTLIIGLCFYYKFSYHPIYTISLAELDTIALQGDRAARWEAAYRHSLAHDDPEEVKQFLGCQGLSPFCVEGEEEYFLGLAIFVESCNSDYHYNLVVHWMKEADKKGYPAASRWLENYGYK